jgi:uncharacterized membrane protein YukC
MEQKEEEDDIITQKKDNSYTYWVQPKQDLPIAIDIAPKKLEAPDLIKLASNNTNGSAWNHGGTW